MEIYMLVFMSAVSVFMGITLTLIVQYYVILRYFNKIPSATPPKKPHSEAFMLPETLRKKLEIDKYDATDCSLAITLMLQFLFHELRHSDSIKRWLYKKLTLEFEELITKTTTGKFFEAVTIRDMHLGSQFPNIKSVGVETVKLDKTEGHIDTLNLCIKLDYSGNFLLSVDAKMKFGKTAYLSIKVKHISGLGRLQFTRLPYTHWSFSFYHEPQLDLAVESHFQGRQLQSNVTNLIVNQIKKAIKRKHTLPNYKIRYKPFFTKADPGQLDIDENEIIPQGQLEIMCMEISRLAVVDVLHIYCTFALDEIPWICVYQKESTTYIIIELTVSKMRQQQLGITFKQEQNLIVVDSVVPQSAGDRASLRTGDVLLTVDGKSVSNITQLNKQLKMLPVGSFSIRVERVVTNYLLKSKYSEKTEFKTPASNTNSINECDLIQAEQNTFVVVDAAKSPLTDSADLSKKIKSISSMEKSKSSDKLPIPKLISNSNENVSKFAQTLGTFSLRKRKASIDRSSADSSSRSTPTTPQHSSLKQHTTLVFSGCLNTSKRQSQCIMEVPDMKSEETDPLLSPVTEMKPLSIHSIEVYKGQVKECQCVINFNDEYSFNLKESYKYLNINVWGTKSNNKEILLGYTNIPLAQILNECNNSMLGHYIKSFSFLPPTSVPPTSQTHPLISHSGFEHVFCYGDALLSFMWTHDDVAVIKRKHSVIDDAGVFKETMVSTSNKHNFVRTQFHRTTHCDFCSKKIWLKDAVQCKICNLCCHKKCLAKCQLNVPCVAIDRSDQKSESLDALQPEITMTEVDDDLEFDVIHYPSGDQMQNAGGLKRINSANNLVVPGSHSLQSQSRSLPPSPQHTPRKLSLVASNPFSMCPAILDEVQQQPDDSSQIILRAVDEVLQYPADEALMDAAKETGSQLYASMGHQIKVDKINFMVTELKRALDSATVEHMNLCKQLSSVDSEVEKAKLAFQIGQADAKIQALSVLMLHYCSGLQHAQEKIV